MIKTEHEQTQEEVIDYIHRKEQDTRPSTLYTPKPPMFMHVPSTYRERIRTSIVDNDIDNIKLKPCPFCSSDAEMVVHYRPVLDELEYVVRCFNSSCLVIPETKGARTAEKAALIWNTRWKGEDD